MQLITEVSATIKASAEKKISKELEVFYNPVMQTNRDISILLLKALKREEMIIADPLAGSGIRSLRFLKELPSSMIASIHCNDYREGFIESMQENTMLSQCDTKKLVVTRNEATKMLLNNPSFDYIDVDPFGSPNPFLDAAIKKIRRNGILAITATDTAPLSGTYPKACLRKYWAKPRRDFLMHEFGLRILIRKCQLIGAQYEKSLLPIMSYSKDHYFRVFFLVTEGKSKVDLLLEQQQLVAGFGPLWTGQLWDKRLVNDMWSLAVGAYAHQEKFLSLLVEESQLQSTGFFDIHMIAKELQQSPPKHERVLDALKEKNFLVVRTHFSPLGIRTQCSYAELKKIIEGLS